MIDAKITRGWDADDLRHADVDWGDEIEPPRKRKPWTPLDFPPQLRWGVRRGASIAERPKGTNGKRLCGWCDHDLPKYRRSWCSDQCAEKFQRVWSWGALREYIIGRDVVCQRCGSDWAGWLRTKPTGMYSRDPRDRNQCLLERAPWQVDHIFPVKDGGTDDPENLRLLCNGCHIAVGYEQRGARAKPRNCQNEPPFPGELAGVMCLLADPDLVCHPRDFRCYLEAPHRWEDCAKCYSLHSFGHDSRSNNDPTQPPKLQVHRPGA